MRLDTNQPQVNGYKQNLILFIKFSHFEYR